MSDAPQHFTPIERTPEGGCLVTTSWDDGHALDLRLAELLDEIGVKATFYVPKHGSRRTASDQLIRRIASRFEIGAHGITHSRLPALPLVSQRSEICESKAYIEHITGTHCRTFAYPFGDISPAVIDNVIKAGYLGARTVRTFRNALPLDRYQLTTTIHACRLAVTLTITSPTPDDPNDLRRLIDFNLLRMAGTCEYDWLSLALRCFRLIYHNGGVLHIWGHSWEINEHGLWGPLKALLQYVISQPNVISVSNSGLLARY